MSRKISEATAATSATAGQQIPINDAGVSKRVTVEQVRAYVATGTKLDDLGTPDDNTDLNASTNRHGLLPKLGGGTTNFLRADGTWASPTADSIAWGNLTGDIGDQTDLTPAAIGAVAEGDSRLTDARDPNAHASSHATAGSDPIAAADIGAEVAGAVSSHEGAANPHPQYIQAQQDGSILLSTDVTQYTANGQAGFTNAGANIEYSGGAWRNKVGLSSTSWNTGNVSTSNTTTSGSPTFHISASTDTGAGYQAYKATDGVASGWTSFWASSAGAPQYLIIDLLTNPLVFGAYAFFGNNGAAEPKSWTVQGTNAADDSAWVVLDTQTNQTLPTDGTWTSNYTIASPASYKRYKINITATRGGDNPALVELKFFVDGPASTSNTIDTPDLISTTATIAPATLKVYSDSGLTVAGTSDYNIAYSVDNGSNWSSYYTGAQFIADSGGTIAAALAGISNLKLRLQPIGTAAIWGVRVDSPSSSLLLGIDGTITETVNGVEVWFTDQDGDQTSRNQTMTGSMTIGVRSVVTAAGTTTGADSDHFVVFTGSTTQTYTMPACSTGRVVIVKNRSSGNVTVNRAGSDTIDGGTSDTLASNESATYIGNGTDWTVN